MQQIEIIGLAAALLGALRLFPIVHHVYKTRRTNNFPYIALVFALTSNLLWVIYGTFDKTYANIVAGSIFFTAYAFVLLIKLTSRK